MGEEKPKEESTQPEENEPLVSKEENKAEENKAEENEAEENKAEEKEENKENWLLKSDEVKAQELCKHIYENSQEKWESIPTHRRKWLAIYDVWEMKTKSNKN